MLNSLRPQNLKEFVGQEKIKKTIRVMIESSTRRKTSIDHTLLIGKPGLGKTSLSTVIANELGVDIRYSQGPLLEKKADLLALFGSIKKNQIIFIDEIHAINKNVEELLYSIMEDGVIDIQIGPEGDSKFVRIKIPEFTLVGATTKSHSISKPLKDRFGVVFSLNNYLSTDIEKILKQSAKKLKVSISPLSLKKLSESCDFTPRIGNNLLKRCIDFMIYSKKTSIDQATLNTTFKNLGIYPDGLKERQIEYLIFLNNNFYEQSVSINHLMNMLNIPKQTILSEIEPSLIAKGYIEIKSSGRSLTTKAINYLTNGNNHK